MAVDLTTGSYDEEGIFSKYNDDSRVSEKFDAKENFCSLKNFRSSRIIKESLNEKFLVVEGHFVGDDRPAIIVVEKMPFETRDLMRIFTADSRLELKFRNNIYANYHVYPSNGFNGFDIKVIHPANAEDYLEFVDEPLRMVNESAVLYKSVVLPHLKSLTGDKWYSTCNSDSDEKVLYTEDDPKNGFILIEDNPKSCSCTTKHIRALCILQRKDILSLRDLTSENITVLSHLKQKCLEKLSSKYNIPDSKLLSYVCYPPEHFPFHVYFETVEKDHPIPAEKAHLLETVIFNLQLISDYYKKVNLTYSLAEKNILLKKIQDASAGSNCA